MSMALSTSSLNAKCFPETNFFRFGKSASLRIPNQDGRANRTSNPMVFSLPTHFCEQVRWPGER